MNQDTITRVQRTWALALSRRKPMTEAFYSHFFALEPATRGLFEEEMELQHSKFDMTFAFFVSHLSDHDALASSFTDLGTRHACYGVSAAHYEAFGEALILAFQEQLGTEFEQADAQAWRQCYGVLADLMCDAGNSNV